MRITNDGFCIKNDEFWKVNFSAGVPGYLARAQKLGYRTVAAASGTTANVLQYLLWGICMHNLDPKSRGKWELNYVYIFPGVDTV